MGCGFGLGLLALAMLTGAVLSGVPSLARPGLVQRPNPAADATKAAASAPAPPEATSGLILSAPLATPTSSAGTLMGQSDNPWEKDIPEAACIPADLPQTGHVLQVIDGVTIRVLMDQDQRVYAVRYLGLELPSGANPELALSAARRNTELAYGQRITLVRDLTDLDGYGRMLRYAMVGHTFINYDLIAGGYDQAKLAPPDTACSSTFQGAEAQAQLAGLGLWSPPTPKP